MTTDDRKWIEEMILQLRLRDVRGGAIGDAVAQIESHCALSGESAAEAFGDPRDYARSLDFPAHETEHTDLAGWARVLVPILAGVAALVLVGATAAALRRGADVEVGWGSLVSLAVWIGLVALLVRHTEFFVHRVAVGALAFAVALAVLVLPTILLPETAFTVPAPLAAALTLGLLAYAMIAQRRERHRLVDPVTDPVDGRDRTEPSGRMSRRAQDALMATEWHLVIAAVVIASIAWSVG
ncbi:hypothetical protein [Agilicoccus flavus]|uniref:hypothetical protein n=1 Tax=Agilicoccus flavus TaxID=2775968 RepID=UPI001CF6E9F8|nr:hypothetical protein [Agilicoccus flavus]